MRSAVDGWVENRRAMSGPLRRALASARGLWIQAYACCGATCCIGRCLATTSMFSSARASDSPEPSNSAAPRSASNSRDRLTAICINPAATGARNAMSSAPTALPPSSSSPPPKMAENIAIWARKLMPVAIAAATEPIRMSRWRTCIISWASTPSTSLRGRVCHNPSVTHTTAWWGLRPVAKALGWGSGEIATVGIGRFARWASPATIWYSSGASAAVTTRARAARRASLSLFQYENPTMPRPKSRPISSPVDPPSNPPTRTARPPRPASRVKVLKVFLNIWDSASPWDVRGIKCTERT